MEETKTCEHQKLTKSEMRKLEKQRRKERKKSGLAKIQFSNFLFDEDNNNTIEENNEDDIEIQQIFENFEKNANRNRMPDFSKKNTEEEDINEANDSEQPILSKSKIKKYGRPSIAALKMLSRRPDLVEANDTNAPDPFTLVEVKNLRNVVPVPEHWQQKRKYLNYKKGDETSSYRLPTYLEKTGVHQVRQAILDAETSKSLSSKKRQRVKPQTGLFDSDPRVLHDAFFVQQTKPLMTKFGDIYFEGKEYEILAHRFKPGVISDKLRTALNMGPKSPPPWLHKMQKYGPPPSYTNIKIPGLTAPIPKGCSWGSGPDGWGQVPVYPDSGLPIYGGNPFGEPEVEDETGKELWGKIDRGEIKDGVN